MTQEPGARPTLTNRPLRCRQRRPGEASRTPREVCNAPQSVGARNRAKAIGWFLQVVVMAGPHFVDRGDEQARQIESFINVEHEAQSRDTKTNPRGFLVPVDPHPRRNASSNQPHHVATLSCELGVPPLYG
jgi:hypothetical protein